MTQPGNFFSGEYLDRRAEERVAADWLAAARGDAGTRYLAMQGTAALMRADAAGEPTCIAFLPPEDPRVAETPSERLVLMGWFQQARCVLVELDPGVPESDHAQAARGEQFAELRPLACTLSAEDAGLLAYARALTIWRSTHRFCGRCGAATLSTRAGHARHCSQCDHESFPRIDPAIIVLVRHGERALLGRQHSWPPGRYSTLAGFVEPGESLEDAVRREVREEASIVVRAVHYHSSQPWPFPSALMLGFLADCEGGQPHAQDEELEDVQWFTRAQVRSGEILLPPAESISRRLIEHWLQQDGSR